MSRTAVRIDQLIFRILLFFAAGGFYVSIGYAANQEANEVKITRLLISPDGNTVVFQFINRLNRVGTGLWDWRNAKLRAIENPQSKSLRDPSFTPDGKRLLALTEGGSTESKASDELVSVDLTTLKISGITHLPHPTLGFWSDPVLQPGGEKVLFLVKRPYHLVLFDLKTGQVTKVLDERVGFRFSLGGVRFVGAEEVIFSGMNPMEPSLAQKAAELQIRASDVAAYRFRFGGQVELVYPTMPTADRNDPGVSSISASGDGRKLGFVALSRKIPYNEKGQYNLEFFTLEDGVITQRTDLQSHMAYAQMSSDACAVVFGVKKDREGPRSHGHKFHVLDLHTGVVTSIDLAELMKQAPDFSP